MGVARVARFLIKMTKNEAAIKVKIATSGVNSGTTVTVPSEGVS